MCGENDAILDFLLIRKDLCKKKKKKKKRCSLTLIVDSKVRISVWEWRVHHMEREVHADKAGESM